MLSTYVDRLEGGAANGSERFALRIFDNRFLVRQRPTLITSGRGVSAKRTSPGHEHHKTPILIEVRGFVMLSTYVDRLEGGAANGSERFALRIFDNRFLVRQRPTLITSGRSISAKGTSPATSTTKPQALTRAWGFVFYYTI